jgi:hypothetical protein
VGNDERKLQDAAARNREIAEHVRRMREHLAQEREEIERVRHSIADTREHIQLTQRFLRGEGELDDLDDGVRRRSPFEQDGS